MTEHDREQSEAMRRTREKFRPGPVERAVSGNLTFNEVAPLLRRMKLYLWQKQIIKDILQEGETKNPPEAPVTQETPDYGRYVDGSPHREDCGCKTCEDWREMRRRAHTEAINALTPEEIEKVRQIANAGSLPSRRLKIAREAVQWCQSKKVNEQDSFNFVTALVDLGYITGHKTGEGSPTMQDFQRWTLDKVERKVLRVAMDLLFNPASSPFRIPLTPEEWSVANRLYAEMMRESS